MIIKRTLSALFALFTLFTLSTLPTHAAIFEANDLVTLTSRTPDDVYTAGRVIRVEQRINGDFIGAAGTIEIEANVSGDVMAAGGNIIINGNVSDDVRVAGGNIEINGKIQDDLIVAGGKVIIGPNAVINGDVRVGASEFMVMGEVKGRIDGAVGALDVQGKVTGDIEVTIDQDLEISKQGFVSGNLNYSAWKPLGIPRERIGGELIYSKIVKEPSEHVKSKVQGSIITILAFLVLGAVLLKLAPKYQENILTTCKEGFWRNLLVGIAWLILAPIITILLFITVIGTPLAIALIAFYVLVIIMGYVVAAYWIGASIYKPKNDTMWIRLGKLLLGLVVISLLWYIPIVGWLIALVIFITSTGALLNTSREKKPAKKVMKKKKK